MVFEKFNGLTITGLGMFIVNNNQRVWLVLSLPIFLTIDIVSKSFDKTILFLTCSIL